MLFFFFSLVVVIDVEKINESGKIKNRFKRNFASLRRQKSHDGGEDNDSKKEKKGHLRLRSSTTKEQHSAPSTPVISPSHKDRPIAASTSSVDTTPSSHDTVMWFLEERMKVCRLTDNMDADTLRSLASSRNVDFDELLLIELDVRAARGRADALTASRRLDASHNSSAKSTPSGSPRDSPKRVSSLRTTPRAPLSVCDSQSLVDDDDDDDADALAEQAVRKKSECEDEPPPPSSPNPLTQSTQVCFVFFSKILKIDFFKILFVFLYNVSQ